MKPVLRSAPILEIADGIVETSREWPRVPDGIYVARYLGHECVEMDSFGKAPRVFVHLKIIDPGEHFGKVLYRAYSVRRFKSSQRKGVNSCTRSS